MSDQSTNAEAGPLVSPTGAATNLERAITELIEQYGLAAVYYDVRRRDGFCSNCGTPYEPYAVHQMAGMGYCEIVR